MKQFIPIPIDDIRAKYGDAVTLRDLFAAQAIPMATKWEEEAPTGSYNGGAMEPTYKGIAQRAYLLADAMLAERNK